MQGNCKTSFPTAASLGLKPFSPPLPAQKPRQCLLVLDGSSLTDSSTDGKPRFDIEVTHSGTTCPLGVDCPDGTFSAMIEDATAEYPIWMDRLMFHSVHPTTETGLWMERDIVLTNVSLAGIQSDYKKAIWFGAANAMHMEGARHWLHVPCFLNKLLLDSGCLLVCRFNHQWLEEQLHQFG